VVLHLPPFCGCPILEQVPYYFVENHDLTLDLAIPSLFLPCHRASAQVAGREQENEWEILEVQSVSPPNERSWFFTEGEVLSGAYVLLAVHSKVVPTQNLDGQMGSFSL
jgi:hypothetical protein